MKFSKLVRDTEIDKLDVRAHSDIEYLRGFAGAPFQIGKSANRLQSVAFEVSRESWQVGPATS
jgi:hypothetical protein